MIAGILLTRERIRAYLISLGHVETTASFKGKSGSYTWWRTPWGTSFSVPDGCDPWQLQRMVDEIDKHKPVVN